ncbi:calcium-binding protein [Algirhabdus cladophorae]|uniref:calcium-binding protein n=1 Tax=Algirhabdus cladophorae TaxID=3377108 RepID=UPI003B848B5F
MSVWLTPATPLFVVNSTVIGLQMDADLTALVGGGYVAVWTHQSGAPAQLRAQLFDAAGFASGPEMALTADLVGQQTRAEVVALADGGFFLTYTSSHYGSALGVFGQRFDASGVAQPDVFAAKPNSQKVHFDSSAVQLANGDLLMSYTALGRDGSDMGIYAQRFDLDGRKIGAELRINDFSTGAQSDSQVIALANGGFGVLYRSRGIDGSDFGIATRWFDAMGAEVLRESVVNQTVDGDQLDGGMVQLASGEVVVVWQSDGAPGTDTGIYARVISQDGLAWGAEFAVAAAGQGNQITPSVLALPDGGYTVLWQGAENSIQAQRFDANHLSVGTATQVNSGTSGALQNPQGAILENGDMVLTWGTTNDGSGNGIEAQIFQGAYIGTARADRLDDTAQTNRMYGEDGADILRGLDGADIIEGQGGRDTLLGNEGADKLYGGNGHDKLRGGQGDDRLHGGQKNDVLTGGRGDDRLTGGQGDDMLTGGAGQDVFIFRSGDGRDEILDFDLATEALWLDADIWGGGLTARQVVSNFAEIQSDDVVFVFSSEDQIRLRDVSDLEALSGAIDLIS